MAAEVYPSSSSSSRTIQAWRAIFGWLAFFLHMLLRILPSAPAWVRIVVGEHRRIVFEAEGGGEVGFEPVLVEIPGEEGVSVDGGVPTLEKLTVVLDLDETLVCAYETSSLPEVTHIQAIEAGLKYFELECLSAEREVDGKPKINHVTVFERPGLHEFLQGISEFADLVLFTAGLEGYARPLVDRIDPRNKFSLRLYRPSTTATEYRDHVKDLSCLSKNFCRIVIVDNNPFSFLLQPLNGIPCVPFYAGQPYDDQLMVVLLPLLKQLSLQKDVRPVLYERFHMPEWFQKHGIPMSNWIMCDSTATA